MVVEAIARVQLLFGVRNKASLIEDVVSCVCRRRREKVLGSQAGKVGHDTSGWLVTKGLQLIHCRVPRFLGSSCVVSASLLAGGRKEGSKVKS